CAFMAVSPFLWLVAAAVSHFTFRFVDSFASFLYTLSSRTGRNIFLHQSPNGEIVKVVDFGIAKLLGNQPGADMKNLTRTGSFVGTPSFISPERLKDAPYDGRSDVYSLGVVFYQMLAGHLPFVSKDHDVYAVITMHLTKQPQSLLLVNPRIPESVNTLVLRMLLKNPAIRPTAEEVQRETKSLLERLALEETPAPKIVFSGNRENSPTLKIHEEEEPEETDPSSQRVGSRSEATIIPL
ncbi:MAG: protein kinase, partial [Blastocatellia bacterium]|nr:protein kinase [Blastocatellia bacterium]